MGTTRLFKGCLILLVLVTIQAEMARIYSTTDSTRLQFEPPQPRPGQGVTIIYDASGGPLGGEKEFFLIYGFTAWDTAIERQKQIRLEPRNGKFLAEVSLPPEATYLWCFVRGSKENMEDTNDGTWWDSYLFTDEGISVQGARLERAEMYQLGRLSIQDRDIKAVQLFEEELKSFPTSARAWYLLWGHRYKIANRSIQAKATITAEIRQLYEAHRDEPWAYNATVLGFNQLGNNDEAVIIMREFVKRFPQDSSMDSLIPTFFGNWGNLEDLESLSTRSKRWEDNSYYWYRLLQAYRNIKAKPERFYRAGQKLLDLTPKEKDPGGNTRFTISEIWLEFGVDPKEAERVAREAVAIAEIGEKPGFVSFSKEKKKILERQIIININRNTLGWALYHQQRYEEALKELEQAVKLREKENIMTRNVYYRLGKTLEKLGRPKEAMETYLKELAWSEDSEPHRAAVIELYRRLNGNLDGLESFIRSRVNELIMQTIQQYVEHLQDFNEDLGRFELPDSQGKPINLSQYKGKVVIIDFWATWCAPCLMTLEHTHKLQQASPDQIVVIAVSQDPEERHNRAVEYLGKKGYNFILVFDDEKKRSIELPYVPARLILDRQGRLRVRELGYSKETEYLFEKKLVGLLSKVKEQTGPETMTSVPRSFFSCGPMK